MRILFYILFFIIAIILQLTIVPLFSIKEITPDLVLIVVFSVSFQTGKVWGVIAGFIAGLVFDLFGTGFVGLSSLANSISAFVAGFWGSEQLERRIEVIFGLLLVAIFIHDFLYFAILRIGTSLGFWNTLFKNIIPHTIYTLVFMVMIHLVFPKALLGRIRK